MGSSNTKTGKRKSNKRNYFVTILFLILLCVLLFFILQNKSMDSAFVGSPTEIAEEPRASSVDSENSYETDLPDQSVGNTEQMENTQNQSVDFPVFEPYHTESTNPSNLLTGTGIMVDGTIVDSYTLEEEIDFGYGDDYTALEGIIGFRGNNFRDTAFYGVASINNAVFSEQTWNISTGSLNDAGGNYWSGNGWTGQPLIVKWPLETRANMKNMYDWAREADELVEVIYPSMDGNIYFIELISGEKTRDDINIGYTFKGAGSLDPRGYPILYVGSGVNSIRGTSRVFIISLIDGSIMYEFGAADGFSLRGQLSYFDSSALVDVDTDQLIYPGENGILYIIKLNSSYDITSGTVSINPSRIVKWRYNGIRTGNAFWLGMEDSAIIWRGHIIFADNGGNMMCLNLNTLEIIWVQDVLDDTNSTPVLELENGHPYVYISTSFHGGWRAPSSSTATIPIWKLDAITGEIVWKYEYSCYTVDGTSGGVQGSPAIGKNGLSELIFYPVARTPNPATGVIVALNKKTGEMVWEQQTQVYSWSSPVAVYDADGKGYIVFCTSSGHMYLMDGLTGDILDSINLGSNIEASPAVFNNNIVVGTRGSGIWGVTLK